MGNSAILTENYNPLSLDYKVDVSNAVLTDVVVVIIIKYYYYNDLYILK